MAQVRIPHHICKPVRSNSFHPGAPCGTARTELAQRTCRLALHRSANVGRGCSDVSIVIDCISKSAWQQLLYLFEQ